MSHVVKYIDHIRQLVMMSWYHRWCICGVSAGIHGILKLMT